MYPKVVNLCYRQKREIVIVLFSAMSVRWLIAGAGAGAAALTVLIVTTTRTCKAAFVFQPKQQRHSLILPSSMLVEPPKNTKKTKNIVLIADFESFNWGLYDQAAAAASDDEVKLTVFENSDIRLPNASPNDGSLGVNPKL